LLDYPSARFRVVQRRSFLIGSKQECPLAAPVAALPATIKRHKATAVYEDMEAIFNRLYVQIKLHQWDEVQATLASAAELPGFYGVTEQKWALFRFAKRHGYEGPLPEISFLTKVKHGEPIIL